MLSADQIASVFARVRHESIADDEDEPLAVPPELARRRLASDRDAPSRPRRRTKMTRTALALTVALASILTTSAVAAAIHFSVVSKRAPSELEQASVIVAPAGEIDADGVDPVPSHAGYTYLGRCVDGRWQEPNFSRLPACGSPASGERIVVGANTAGVRVRRDPTQKSNTIARLRPRDEVVLVEVFSTPSLNGGAYVWGRITW